MIDQKLPAHWKVVPVREAGQVQLGRQRSPEHHEGPNMRPYLRVANVQEARIDTDDVKQMNFTPTEYERFKLEPEDILLNEGQSLDAVGRPAMYRGEVPGACFQNTLIRFRAGDLTPLRQGKRWISSKVWKVAAQLPWIIPQLGTLSTPPG